MVLKRHNQSPGIYFIVEGEVNVVYKRQFPAIIRLGNHDHFGETCVIDCLSHFSFVCVRTTVCMFLEHSRLQELVRLNTQDGLDLREDSWLKYRYYLHLRDRLRSAGPQRLQTKRYRAHDGLLAPNVSFKRFVSEQQQEDNYLLTLPEQEAHGLDTEPVEPELKKVLSVVGDVGGQQSQAKGKVPRRPQLILPLRTVESRDEEGMRAEASIEDLSSPSPSPESRPWNKLVGSMSALKNKKDFIFDLTKVSMNSKNQEQEITPDEDVAGCYVRERLQEEIRVLSRLC